MVRAILPYLPAFEAFVRHGNLRAAAEDLSLTPGAVSQQLARLAENLNFKIFRRSGRRLVLTAAGEAFAREVSQSLAGLGHAIETSRRTQQSPAKLRVAIPPSLAFFWMNDAIMAFAEERNIHQVEIRACRKAVDVDWSKTDLAIVYDNPPFKGLSWNLLREVRLRPVCTPEFLGRLVVRPGGLARKRAVLLHEDDGTEWRRWFQVGNFATGEYAEMFLPSVAHVVAAALSGQGIALVSDVLVGPQVAAGRLVVPAEASIPASCAYYFLAQDHDVARAEYADLRRYLVEYLDGDKGKKGPSASVADTNTRS